MKKEMTKFIFIAIVLSITSLTANALTVTYNGSVSPSTVGSAVTTDLPMFDAGLGTLTGVQITLNFDVTPFAQVANFSSSTPLVFSSNEWITFGYTSANIWTVTHGTDSWALAAPTVTTGTIYGSGQSVAYFSILTLVGSTSAPVSLTESGLDLAGYIGAGSLTFGTSGPGNVVVSAGLLSGGGGGNLVGTASVTYDYIPEPATICMLGLGGLLLRRRKSA